MFFFKTKALDPKSDPCKDWWLFSSCPEGLLFPMTQTSLAAGALTFPDNSRKQLTPKSRLPGAKQAVYSLLTKLLS